ncbi:MAG: hypothetical protein KF774_13155 [Planctomyces sp.]|nr:hypothetical protein [Planctomyces sp.]
MSAVVAARDSAEFDPGSFRDRDSRVFRRGSGLYRALSETALQDWRRLSAASFLKHDMQTGRIVRTRLVDDVPPPRDARSGEDSGWAAVLEHDPLPFVSYPYEWCFGMLRDAALLHLDLLQAALAEELILKDATPFNVQFRGVRPCFIDLGSFVQHHPAEPWIGYRQFCQTMLYPLMLQAYRGIDFQPWLRGRISGIAPGQFVRLLSIRDWLRRGVLTHVVLHAALEGRADREGKSTRQGLQQSGFNRSLILANVSKLRRTVSRLSWQESGSAWSEYDAESEPVRQDAVAKEDFVGRVVESGRWKLAWDLGCNLGRYSRIAARRAAHVVAMDFDHWTIERLYRDLGDEGQTLILPLVVNLADASPGLGWRGAERRPLERRGRPDLILALALIHHLVIRENLRLGELLEWFRLAGDRSVIEFVDREDPQVRSLLKNRTDGCEDYSRENFERELRLRFDVLQTLDLPSGTRTLFDVRPR